MSLAPPEKVQKLQTTLHVKAKGAPGYRFYALYDKVHREDILSFAYRCCQANGGAAGVDDQDFADIEKCGVEQWLGELTQELRTKTYRPQAVRRVWIAKPQGGKRPLGIPTVKDRVVQMAALLVLGPIFEADLPPEQFAYRPGRGALDAVKLIRALLKQGHRQVVDADLSGYFDSIPHAELMKSLARRISDRHVLHLIKMWLTAAVEETDERGHKQRTTRNKDTGRGTPQGAPISPLLANLYMRRFVLGWKALGHARRLGARIVNYADDFVICCRGSAEEAMQAMRDMMQKLKLTVNETKTCIRQLPDETFDFLGYTFGRHYVFGSGAPYYGMRPSRKAISRILRAIRETTSRREYYADIEVQVTTLNRMLNGWANYFCMGQVSLIYEQVDAHMRCRLRRWLCRKHKQPGRGCARYPLSYLYETLGLVRLRGRKPVSWATT